MDTGTQVTRGGSFKVRLLGRADVRPYGPLCTYEAKLRASLPRMA
jgi:hypothetical protein